MFIVKTPLKTLEGILAPGSSIRLTAEEAADLVACGALEGSFVEGEDDVLSPADPSGAAAPGLDPEIEGAFPSDAELMAMSKMVATAYAIGNLGIDKLVGNAAEVKAQVIDLVGQAKAQLYADKSKGAAE